MLLSAATPRGAWRAPGRPRYSAAHVTYVPSEDGRRRPGGMRTDKRPNIYLNFQGVTSMAWRGTGTPEVKVPLPAKVRADPFPVPGSFVVMVLGHVGAPRGRHLAHSSAAGAGRVRAKCINCVFPPLLGALTSAARWEFDSCATELSHFQTSSLLAQLATRSPTKTAPSRSAVP